MQVPAIPHYQVFNSSDAKGSYDAGLYPLSSLPPCPSPPAGGDSSGTPSSSTAGSSSSGVIAGAAVGGAVVAGEHAGRRVLGRVPWLLVVKVWQEGTSVIASERESSCLAALAYCNCPYSYTPDEPCAMPFAAAPLATATAGEAARASAPPSHAALQCSWALLLCGLGGGGDGG